MRAKISLFSSGGVCRESSSSKDRRRFANTETERSVTGLWAGSARSGVRNAKRSSARCLPRPCYAGAPCSRSFRILIRAAQPQPVANLVPTTPFAPFVAVTATTEMIRGKSRVRVNQAYTDAILRAGLIPVVAPPLPPPRAADLLAGIAGLVLTGGEDVEPRLYGATPHPSVDVHRSRDESELALFDLVRQRAIPTLAICRGIQLVNVAMGGTLVQDIPTERPNAIVH